MVTKEYQREWRKNHQDSCREYRKTYAIKHPDKIKVWKLRKKSKPKRKEYMRRLIKSYMKDYLKRDYVIKRNRCRSQTYHLYGKVPKGYNRHHFNYDSPHNFILIPIKEHWALHHPEITENLKLKEKFNIK